MNIKAENYIIGFFKGIEVRYKWAFFGSLLCGLLAHLYQFTNKFFNYDELYHTPEGTGEGLALGRWGLFYVGKLVNHFFGNYSLPLVNGMLSLLFIALSACMVVKAFKLKGCLASAITGGLLA
nr:glucosyltransferase domain-containing protein [Lachnospiraceae bacterium]